MQAEMIFRHRGLENSQAYIAGYRIKRLTEAITGTNYVYIPISLKILYKDAL